MYEVVCVCLGSDQNTDFFAGLTLTNATFSVEIKKVSIHFHVSLNSTSSTREHVLIVIYDFTYVVISSEKLNYSAYSTYALLKKLK